MEISRREFKLLKQRVERVEGALGPPPWQSLHGYVQETVRKNVSYAVFSPLAGWDVEDQRLISDNGKVALDASTAGDGPAIWINDEHFGNKGIQIQYAGGAPRMYLGDGGMSSTDTYFMYDDSGLYQNGAQVTHLASGSSKNLMGWTWDGNFSVTDGDTVAWGASTLTFANGDSFSIDAGNTGNMSQLTYIYFDQDASETVFQTTTDITDLNGLDNAVLIGVAEDDPNNEEAMFVTFGAGGQHNIHGNDIVANSILAANIAAGTITAAEITGTNLSAIYADMGTLTAGEIRVGDGELGTNFTGIRLYASGDNYILAGYNNDTRMAYFDTDGRFKAGEEDVTLDDSGLYFQQGSVGTNRIRWVNGDYAIGKIYAYSEGSYDKLYIKAGYYPTHSGYIYINAYNIAASSSITITTGDITISPQSDLYLDCDVGIGTDAPDARLHSKLGSASTYAAFFENTSGDGLGVDIFAGYGSGDGGTILKCRTTLGDRFWVKEGGTAYLTGPLGIGTNSPDEHLHVYHATSDAIALFESGDATSAIVLKDVNTTADYKVWVAAIRDDLSLRAGGSERLRISATGDVGIGTSSISEKLEVNGNILVNRHDYYRAGNYFFVGEPQDPTNSYVRWSVGMWYWDNDNDVWVMKNPSYDRVGIIGLNGGRIAFLTSDDDVSADDTLTDAQFKALERMRIDEDGNVGIGDSTPDSLLDIEGSKASGYVLEVHNTYGSTGHAMYVEFGDSDNTPDEYVMYIVSNNGHHCGDIEGDGSGGLNYNKTSDIRLKSVVSELSPARAMAAIRNVNPIRYRGKGKDGKARGAVKAGFSAQDVFAHTEGVASYREDEDLYLMDYSNLSPYVWAGIQHVDREVEQLKDRVTTLEQALHDAGIPIPEVA